MAVTDIPLPRYDFYQTETNVIAALYLKGYGGAGTAEHVKVNFSSRSVELVLPPLPSSSAEQGVGQKRVELGPLYDAIKPEGSSSRVLSTKIELKLAKASPSTWPSLLSTSTALPFFSEEAQSSTAGPSGSAAAADTTPPGPSKPSGGEVGIATGLPKFGGPDKVKAKRANWDKIVDAELEEKENSDDPNAGGDSALQKMFSQIYSGADEDTKRAMIKSFTESGGTTLSTDWSTIGKEKTPVRPPDGMYQMKP